MKTVELRNSNNEVIGHIDIKQIIFMGDAKQTYIEHRYVVPFVSDIEIQGFEGIKLTAHYTIPKHDFEKYDLDEQDFEGNMDYITIDERDYD
jgi:hypothetical protein